VDVYNKKASTCVGAFLCCMLEIFGPKVGAIVNGVAIVLIEFIEN
jgi:hypothetical protein